MKKAPCMLCGINTRSRRGAHAACVRDYVRWVNDGKPLKRAPFIAVAIKPLDFNFNEKCPDYLKPDGPFFITDVQHTNIQPQQR